MNDNLTIEITGAATKERALHIARSVLNDLTNDNSYFDFQSFTAKRYEAEVKVSFSCPRPNDKV